MWFEVSIPGRDLHVFEADSYEEAVERFEQALWDAGLLADDDVLTASDIGIAGGKHLADVLEEEGFIRYGDAFLDKLPVKFEDLEDWEKEVVQAIMELEGYDLEEAIEVREQYSLYPDIHTEEDLGHYWLFEAGIHDIPDNLANYIDCEKFGRDIALTADGGFTSKGWLERI
jgi:predicted GNAT family N-acyltransferase